MALKIIKVTLNEDGVLDVADGGKGLEFDAAKGVQIVAWSLSGRELASAWFPKGRDLPAFTWIDSPDSGIFSDALVAGSGRRLLIDNDHLNAGSVGEWVYMLRVAYRKQDGSTDYYTTTHSRTLKDGTRTSNNPIIINH